MAARIGAIFAKILEPYNRAVTARPLLTKSLTAGTLVGGGDAIAQLFVERDENGNRVMSI